MSNVYSFNTGRKIEAPKPKPKLRIIQKAGVKLGTKIRLGKEGMEVLRHNGVQSSGKGKKLRSVIGTVYLKAINIDKGANFAEVVYYVMFSCGFSYPLFVHEFDVLIPAKKAA